MKPPLTILLLLFSTTALAQAAPHPAPAAPAPAKAASRPKVEALLLGISTPGQGLRTYLVDAYRVDALGQGLAVPRSDGWWFVDVHGGHLIVKKNGEVTAEDFEDLNDSNCADGRRGGFSQELLYVLSNHLSLTSTHFTQSCNSPLEQSRTWAGTVKLTDANGLTMVAESAPVEDLLGADAAAALDKVAPDVERAPGECGREDCDPERGWILRPTGVFAVKPDPTNDPSETRQLELPLDAALFAKLKRVSTWKPSDGSAAFELSAPSGTFTLRVRADAIEVTAGGRSVGTIHGAAGTRIVMEEWAFGEKNIARWRKEAARVLEQAARSAP